MMRKRQNSKGRIAFSLVELVIVVVIIGTIAAIALPRLSNAAVKSKASAVKAGLASVRKAIDTFYAEHGRYPGFDSGTGAANHTAFARQLLQYTDAKGATSTTYGYPYIYGPYLRPPFPMNPINELNTVHVKAGIASADPADGSVGWVAVLSHGYFGISASAAEITDNKLDVIEGVKGMVKGVLE